MAQSEAAVIAIDGPSGSGKGTVARALAQRLGWHLLDSGALYRVVGLLAERRGVSPADPDRLASIAGDLGIQFAADPADPRIWVEGEEISQALRTERCGELASKVAQLVPVREALLATQRALARPPGLVADGRDMGTVVFPDAVLKVYLTASPEERASRRYKQLKEKGISVSLPGLSREIEERDRRDAERTAAPLKLAEDAYLIDSTALTVEEVVERILTRLRERDLTECIDW
jgi:cytidylate kinase